MSITVAELLVRVSADTSSFQGGMASASAEVDAFVSITTSRANQAVDGFSGRLRHAGMAAEQMGRMLAGAGVAIEGALALAVKAGSHLQESLLDVKANAGLTSAEFAEMKRGVEELAKTVPIGPDKLAAAFRQIHDLGFSTRDSFALMRESAKGVVATGADMVKFSDQTATSMKIFKIAVGDTNKVVEEQIRVMTLGKMTLEQFSQNSGRAHSIAAVLGVKMPDVDSALATLTRQGFDPSQAQTQVIGMLNKIANPAKNVQAMLVAIDRTVGSNLVEDFTAAGLKAKGLQGVIEDIREVAQKAHVDAGALALKLVPQSRGGIGLSSLLNNADEKAQIQKSAEKALAGVGSVVPAQAEERLKTFGAQVEILKNHLTILGEAILKALAPSLTALNQGLQTAIDWFLKLPEPTQEFLVKAMAVAGLVMVAAGALLTFAGQIALVAAGFSAMGVTLEGVGAALASFGAILTGPVGLAIAAVIAAVVALAVAWKNNWGGIQQKTQAVVSFLQPYLSSAWNAIKSTAIQAWGAIRDFLTDIWPPIQTIIVTVWSAVNAYLSGAFSVLTALFQGTWGNLAGIVRGVWNVIVGVVKVEWGLIAGTIAAGLKLLTGDWKGAWDTLQKYAAITWDGLKQLTGGAVSALVNTVEGAGKLLFNAGKVVVDGLVNGIKAGFGKVADAARGLANNVVDGVKGALEIHSPSRVMQRAGSDTVHGLVQGLIDGKLVAKKGGAEIADAVHEGVTGQTQKHLDHTKRLWDQYTKWYAGVKAEIAALNRGDNGPEARDITTRFKELGPEVTGTAQAVLKEKDAAALAKKSNEDFATSLKDAYAHTRTLRAELEALVKSGLKGDPLADLKARFPGVAADRLKVGFGADQTNQQLAKQIDAVKRFQDELATVQAQIRDLEQGGGQHLEALDQKFQSLPPEVMKLVPALDQAKQKLKELQDQGRANARGDQAVMDLMQRIQNAADKAATLSLPEDVRKAISFVGGAEGQSALATWNRLSKATQDYILQLVRTGEAGEHLNGLKERTEASLKELRDYIEAEQASVAAALQGDKAESSLQHFLSTHKQFRVALENDKAAALELMPIMEKLFRDKDTATTVEKLNSMLGAADAELRRLTTSGDEYSIVLDKIGKTAAQLTPQEKALIEQLTSKQKAIEAAKAATKAANQEDRETLTITQRLQNAYAESSSNLLKSVKDTDYLAEVLARLHLAYKDLTADQLAFAQRIARLDQLKDTVGKAAGDLKEVLTNSLESLKGGFKSFFASIVSGFTDMLFRMAAEWASSQIVRLLMNGLTGLLTGGSGGSTFIQAGEGGLGGLTSFSGPVAAPSHVPALAGGGTTIINMTVNAVDAGSFRQSQGQILQDAHRHAEFYRRRNG